MSHCEYGIIAMFSSCFVGYALLNRQTVRHRLSAAIFKKKKLKVLHRYTYLKGFLPIQETIACGL